MEFINKNSLNYKMKLEKEIFLASHVSADGWLSKYIEKNCLQIVHGRKYYKNRMRYTIGYCNNNKVLIELFVRNMFDAFSLKPRYAKNKTQVIFRSKRVYDQLKELGTGDSYNWFIHKSVYKRKRLMQIWLRSFYDDESTLNGKRVIVDSVNKNGLRQVSQLLKKLKINHIFREYNFKYKGLIKKRYRITAYNLEQYYNLIGFNNTEKKSKILKLLRKYRV